MRCSSLYPNRNMHNDFMSKLNALTLSLILSAGAVAGPGSNNGNARDAKSDKTKPATNEKNGPPTEDSDALPKTTLIVRRDPFIVPAKVIRPPVIPKKEKPLPPVPKALPAPSAEIRMNEFKLKMREHLNGRAQEPSKISPYTIEELSVTGIFRNEDGYGAFIVEAASQKQQIYFAREGWQTFDGYIKEILPTGVRFVKTVRYDDGKVVQTEEVRALPNVNAK